MTIALLSYHLRPAIHADSPAGPEALEQRRKADDAEDAGEISMDMLKGHTSLGSLWVAVDGDVWECVEFHFS